MQASAHLKSDLSHLTPTADTNECGRSRTWTEALSASRQPRDHAGQLGWALQARGHLAVLVYSTGVQQPEQRRLTGTTRHRQTTCANDRHRPAWH
jgi:hypothetical protein